ncbi:hypothetical protein TorRG33x02_225610 [Trema orientale]|uniref:Uncharacterized protein n=1 Tax=Trema orientale TaxID=63057 RepID=A0A2P5E815_TREOI|nr:hypothetical protein TorRG33x02_225610 [Trema orientale]
MASPWLGIAEPVDRGRRRLERSHGVRVRGLGLHALLLLPLLRLHSLILPLPHLLLCPRSNPASPPAPELPISPACLELRKELST